MTLTFFSGSWTGHSFLVLHAHPTTRLGHCHHAQRAPKRWIGVPERRCATNPITTSTLSSRHKVVVTLLKDLFPRRREFDALRRPKGGVRGGRRRRVSIASDKILSASPEKLR